MFVIGLTANVQKKALTAFAGGAEELMFAKRAGWAAARFSARRPAASLDIILVFWTTARICGNSVKQRPDPVGA
jgi:hypothetical protein